MFHDELLVSLGYQGIATSSSMAHQTPSSRRPTHFLSLRLGRADGGQLYQRMAGLQREAVERHPELEPCICAPTDAHITLFVMSLADEAQVAMAASALERCPLPAPSSTHGSSCFQLTLGPGLGRFGSGVLFMPLCENEEAVRLRAWVEVLHAAFASENLVEQPHRFKAHVTLMKTSKLKSKSRPKGRGRGGVSGSRGRGRGRGGRVVIGADVEQMVQGGETFGTHTIGSVELLRMSRRDADGFYFCEARRGLG